MFRIKFIIDRKVSWDNFWALKDINFEIKKGEIVGLIGENGAGKSTVLKLIAGMLHSDRGDIDVTGKVAGLLELGAGFQTELTGKDNVYLSASLFGLSEESINNIYEEITDFAGLGKFIHAPVKCYSQGMFVRLAFAVAIHMNPDTLLIDDTLAVGDEFFQKKCIKKVFQLKEQGKTIVFVSHDINMIQRLCSRAIFLREGRVVKDDTADKVIPLYTQTVGMKMGIGIIKKGPVSVVFNNGKIFLNWQNKVLTSDSGGYTLLRIGDKDYSSFQASWEVEAIEGKALIAKGTLYQFGLTQTWKIELTEDNDIKLIIEVEGDNLGEVEQGFVNIMFSNEYSQWFTPTESGDFPVLENNDVDWSAFLPGGAPRKCIGLLSSRQKKEYIPLAFEIFKEDPLSDCQIWNSDYIANCRILQYRQAGLQNISAGRSNSFVLFKGKIILDIPDVGNYLAKIQDDSALSSGKLRIIFNKGQCIIFYNNLSLTKAGNVIALISVNRRWYSSESAYWEVKKESRSKLVAKGIWPDLPVIQIWQIEVNNDSSLFFKIDLAVNEEVEIDKKIIQFGWSDKYENYYSDYGAGKFPEKFLGYQTDILQRCIPDGEVVFQSKDNEYPKVSLRFSKSPNKFAKIFNSDISNRGRALQVNTVESEENVKCLKGRHLCFDVNLVLDEHKRNNLKDIDKVLQRRKIKFIFDKGRGGIYWNDKELTKGLGVYSSLRSKGRWYDSASQVVWIDIEKEGVLEFLGRWSYLPLRQRWQVKLKKNNIIGIDIHILVDKEIEVDRLQTNIMLSERYNQWITNTEKGIFPSFKGGIDDDWEILSTDGGIEQNGEKFIGVLENGQDGKHFPSVKLIPRQIDSQTRLNIVNSDLYQRGRVLQCLQKGRQFLLPGEYVYFRGEIIINF
ncbi:ABC transporter ATP-binding protein [bacterium]|nr:ABC transporter ATP-binding protein [bacterium]